MMEIAVGEINAPLKYSQLSLRRTPFHWHQVSVLERCPSYREPNKGSKERQGPTLSFRFAEVCI